MKKIICFKSDMEEMPKICNHCDFRFNCNFEDAWQGLPDSDHRPDNCPLVAVKSLTREQARKIIQKKFKLCFPSICKEMRDRDENEFLDKLGF